MFGGGLFSRKRRRTRNSRRGTKRAGSQSVTAKHNGKTYTGSKAQFRKAKSNASNNKTGGKSRRRRRNRKH